MIYPNYLKKNKLAYSFTVRNIASFVNKMIEEKSNVKS